MTRKLVWISLTTLLLALGTSALACGTTSRTRHVMHEAEADPVLQAYEDARLALIENSVAGVRAAARAIVMAAHEADLHTIAVRAAVLEEANDLAAARQAFSALSDEVIQYHATRGDDGLVAAYCAMEQKSWLQPVGTITNPYVGKDMRNCGMFAADESSSTHHAHHH